MHLQSVVIYLSAAFFLLYGLAFTLVPAEMAMLVTGARPEAPSAAVDFRATYGGMTVAVGLALVYLNAIAQRRACLVVIIMVLMGMALARALGLVLEGGGNTLMYVYLALEVAGSALAFVAMPARDGD